MQVTGVSSAGHCTLQLAQDTRVGSMDMSCAVEPLQTACSVDPPGAASPGSSSCDTSTSFPPVLAAAIPYAEAIMSTHALPSGAILRQLRKQQAEAAYQRFHVTRPNSTSSSSDAISRPTAPSVPPAPTPARAEAAAAAAESREAQQCTPQQQALGEGSYDQAMALLSLALQQRPALTQVLALAGPAKGAKLLTRLLQARSGEAPNTAFTALLEQYLARLAAEGQLCESVTPDPQQQQQQQGASPNTVSEEEGGGPAAGRPLAASGAGSHSLEGSPQQQGGSGSSTPPPPLPGTSSPGGAPDGCASVRLVQVLQAMLRSGQLSTSTREMLLGRLQARSLAQQQQQGGHKVPVQHQQAAALPAAGGDLGGSQGPPLLHLPRRSNSGLPAPSVAPPWPPLGCDSAGGPGLPLDPRARLPWQMGPVTPAGAPLLRGDGVPPGAWCPPGSRPPRRLPLHPLQKGVTQEHLGAYSSAPSSSGGLPLHPGHSRLQGMPEGMPGGLPGPSGLLPPGTWYPPGPDSMQRVSSHAPPLPAVAAGGHGALPGPIGSAPLPLLGFGGGPMSLPTPLFRGQQMAPVRPDMALPPPGMIQPPAAGAVPNPPLGVARRPKQLPSVRGRLQEQHTVVHPQRVLPGAAAGRGSTTGSCNQLKRTRSAKADAIAALPAKLPATPGRRAARLAVHQVRPIEGSPLAAAVHWRQAPGVGAGLPVDPTLLDTLEPPTLEDLGFFDVEGLGDPLSDPLLSALDDLPPLELADMMF